MIDKDTAVCISIAARPSSFGTTMHNAAYAAAGLNFLYKAFAVTDARAAIQAVRALNIRGCSVSMPFKEQAARHVDVLDPAARAIGAVNTIVNTRGTLKGYNTDAFGALQALRTLQLRRSDRVLVVGAGGVARAIVYALKKAGARKVQVTSRTDARARALARSFSVDRIAWNRRNHADADVLINATPVGMDPDSHQMAVSSSAIGRCRAVMDVVVAADTRLIAEARSLGKDVSPGYEMGLYQAARQFELYTGQDAPVEIMRVAMETLLS